MVQVVWSRQAIDDLDAIRSYIEQFNTAAAERLSRRLILLGESLAEFPQRGSSCGEGRRQMSTVWPYLLSYRYDGSTVQIIAVRHGARDSD